MPPTLPHQSGCFSLSCALCRVQAESWGAADPGPCPAGAVGAAGRADTETGVLLHLLLPSSFLLWRGSGRVFRNLGGDFSFGFNFELVGDVQARTLGVSCTVSPRVPVVSYGLSFHTCVRTHRRTHICEYVFLYEPLGGEIGGIRPFQAPIFQCVFPRKQGQTLLNTIAHGSKSRNRTSIWGWHRLYRSCADVGICPGPGHGHVMQGAVTTLLSPCF